MGRTLPVVTAADAAPPPFARVGIVGLGRMGGSVALAVRRAWPSALVIGVDRNDVLERAQRAHAVDVAADDLGMIADADLVVLARAEAENARVLAELSSLVERPSVVTDLGAAQLMMAKVARGLPPHLAFVGGHPLVVPPPGGGARASADLFRGHVWILTPGVPPPLEALDRLQVFVRTLGASPLVLDAADHDRLVGASREGAERPDEPTLTELLFDAAEHWRQTTLRSSG